MTSGLKGWLEQLADKPAPILEQSRKSALAILEDDKKSSSDCIPIILADPGMAANLFRGINTERLKNNRLPLTTVNSLVSLMGMSHLKDEINAMKSIEQLSLPEINQQGIGRCLKQSWYSEQFAMRWVTDRDVREPEEVRVAAILQYLPELMLWAYGDDVMPRIEHRAYYQCKNYYKEVAMELGCHKREVGAALAERWNLPEIVGFGFSSDYNTYTHGTAVALASLLARLAQHGWYGEDMHFFLNKAMHYFGEQENTASKHIHQQVLSMVAEELALGYRPVASMLVASDDKKYPEIEYRYAALDEDVKPAAKTQAKPEEQVQPKAATTGSADRLAKVQADVAIIKKSVQQQAGIDVLLRQTLDSVSQSLGFLRVHFLLLNPAKDKAETKISRFANNADQATLKLAVSLQPANLFTQLVKKPQAFWLNANNYDKYWSMVPGNVKSVIHVDRFIAASVHFGEKPVGIIYADNQHEEISEEQFKMFQQLTLILNKGLALISKQKK